MPDPGEDASGTRTVVTGLLAVVGAGLVAYGFVRADGIWIAVGGGALAVSLATYAAPLE